MGSNFVKKNIANASLAVAIVGILVSAGASTA